MDGERDEATQGGDPGPGPLSVEDQQVLVALRGLFRRSDSPPGWVVEAAKASFGLRTIDAELAALTWDSLLDEPAVLVRGEHAATAPRSLTFEAGELAIEIEVSAPAPARRIIGQVVPPQRARIEVRLAPNEAGAREVRVLETDDLGRFTLDGVGAGPLSLAVHREGLPVVTTEWVVPGG